MLTAIIKQAADPGNASAGSCIEQKPGAFLVTPEPLSGAANVTVTLGTGLPLASVTVAMSGAVKAVFTVALCGVPAVAAIVAGPLVDEDVGTTNSVML